MSIYNFAGTTDVIGDVVGYYTEPGVSMPGGGVFHAMAPQRFLDTRPEADNATLSDGQTVFTQITGRAGIPGRRGRSRGQRHGHQHDCARLPDRLPSTPCRSR